MANKSKIKGGYRKSKVGAASTIERLREIRKIFSVNSISYLTNINRDTLFNLTSKTPKSECSLQIANAIEYMYQVYIIVLKESEVIKKEITNLPLRHKY